MCSIIDLYDFRGVPVNVFYEDKSFEKCILWILQNLVIEYLYVHLEILHMSWQQCCHDMCKILIWLGSLHVKSHQIFYEISGRRSEPDSPVMH